MKKGCIGGIFFTPSVASCAEDLISHVSIDLLNVQFDIEHQKLGSGNMWNLTKFIRSHEAFFRSGISGHGNPKHCCVTQFYCFYFAQHCNGNPGCKLRLYISEHSEHGCQRSVQDMRHLWLPDPCTYKPIELRTLIKYQTHKTASLNAS